MTQKQTKHRRGIYLLPNILTTGGLFAGFLGIVNSMQGRFEWAAIAVFVAMIMDGFDGRIARLTNTESDFGAQYDSLADIVSFGVAPALIVYNWALTDAGKFGWISAFVFVAAGALRLARFNTQIGIQDKRYFQGLAIPSAAAIICGMVWCGEVYGLRADVNSLVVGVITIVTALLMVSNFRYHSFKQVAWREKVPFVAILVIVLIFIMIAIEPPLVLFVGFSLYGISGPIYTLWTRRNLRPRRLRRTQDNVGEN